MNSPIRPPGTPATGLTGPDGVADLRPGETAPTAAGARGATGVSAPEAQAQVAETGTGEWLRRLEVGEVSRAEAVEGLVAQAVEAHGGARLSAAQRVELAEVLRSALLEDPVLGELLAG
jgi:hypothetical protein